MEGDEYIDSSSDTDEAADTTTSTASNISGNLSMNIFTEGSGPVDYDTALPVEHNYLGEDLEELRGRTLLDEGSTQLLSLLPQPGVVLVPGQTLPLMVFYPPTVNMLRDLVQNNGTFGVVCIRHYDALHQRMANIGTTAEIYEYSDDENQIGFRIKAKGRQRFQIIDTERHLDGNITGNVKILPEVMLPPSLFEQGLRCLDRFRTVPSNGNPASAEHQLRLKRQHRVARADSIVTPWPSFVHMLYNAHNLCKRMKSDLSYLKLGSTTSTTTLPSDPSELSFWAAQALPLLDEQRLTLLRVNSPIQRLRWQLSILEKCQTFVCRDCEGQIADPKEAFSMSAEGPHGTYVNPGGFVHETLTVHRAKGLKCVNEAPSTEYSWFPGYAWTVAECSHCNRHVGWKFTATNKSLKPQKFWGIRRNSILTKLIAEDDVQPVI